MKPSPQSNIPSVSPVTGGGYPLPVLVTDTREQRPLVFEHLDSIPETLQTGDYSIKGFIDCFSVERKSISDLLNSLTRERKRFEKELHRLSGIGARGFARLLVVGTKKELQEELSHRLTTQNAVIGSLCSINADGVPVVWCATPKRAAAWVESCAVYFYNRKLKQLGQAYKTPAWARAAAMDMIP